jgi:dihydroneopterin aldolase
VVSYGVVSYGVLLEGVAQVLEREAFQLLETGIRRVREHVLERFPEVWKPTVRAKVRVPVARAASGVPVEASSGW